MDFSIILMNNIYEVVYNVCYYERTSAVVVLEVEFIRKFIIWKFLFCALKFLVFNKFKQE